MFLSPYQILIFSELLRYDIYFIYLSDLPWQHLKKMYFFNFSLILITGNNLIVLVNNAAY